MIDISKGRWWDDGPVVVKGCTKISPGCKNCWLLSMTRRYQKGKGFVEGNNWTGKIETNLDRLLKVCASKKPKVISIWGDLFHEAVPFQFQLDAWLAMEQSRRHTFLVLTKRPDKMVHFYSTLYRCPPELSGIHVLSNLWNGLTICNQQEADEKITVLLQVPGKKFICHEPALEIIDYGPQLTEISCLISGGETGPGARPSHPDNFRSDRDQCAAAGVPFFFKSWGEWFDTHQSSDMTLNGRTGYFETGGFVKSNYMPRNMVSMLCVGKKAAGRLLDGRTHNDLPWVKT